jgi:hypothetical protein
LRMTNVTYEDYIIMHKNKNRFKDRTHRNTYPMSIAVDVPEGVSGDWKVERFTIPQENAVFFNMQQCLNGNPDRYIEAGTYTRLMYKNIVVMSDTPAERRDHIEFLSRVKGNVLINGLGLGYAIEACCRKAAVKHITVIEKSLDVIMLCKQHYLNKYLGKVDIIHADAFTWVPPRGARYDAVWHDIWNHRCSDNLEEMDQLHQKYKGISDWQGSWCRNDCEKMAKIEARLRSRRASGPHHFDEDEVA